MDITKIEVPVGQENLVIQTGLLAKQANGAVVIGYGDSVVLATATGGPARAGIDFFPLTVSFEEKMYAAGKMPGGFFKREGRPSEHAVLSSRQADRPIRPLFPEGFKDEVQIIITALSSDMVRDLDVVGLVGASAALMISDIPFLGPIAAVRVGRIDGNFVVNPSFADLNRSDLELVVAGTRDAITMVEGSAAGIDENVIIDALEFAFKSYQPLIDAQFELAAKAGKPKYEFTPDLPPADIVEKFKTEINQELHSAIYGHDKKERETKTHAVFDKFFKPLVEDETISQVHAQELFKKLQKNIVRTRILEEEARPDGRGVSEIRPIYCEVGFLPRTHGSALFTRGQTQALTVTTLAGRREEQRVDGISEDENKRYMHQYNFPPFCTGEVKPMRSPGRREIGHGHLAERALLPVIPPMEEFPYVVRLVSEILESNGSSSMASVCGSTLSLMDAGVPIKKPVAGIAMGLITGEDGKYKILTDIQGLEDALGDMDFKVAGTNDGITALQMDIKTKGLSWDALKAALFQARDARLFIIDKMLETISEPKKTLSPFAVKIVSTTIPVEKIGEIIGPGGRTIRKLTAEFSVDIDIEDDGMVFVSSLDYDAAKRALDEIISMVKEVEVGEVYSGVVTRLMNFGAFVEILPSKEGLVHISQISAQRVNKVQDVLKPGQKVVVKVSEIDDMGRINLTMKGVDQTRADN